MPRVIVDDDPGARSAASASSASTHDVIKSSLFRNLDLRAHACLDPDANPLHSPGIARRHPLVDVVVSTSTVAHRQARIVANPKFPMCEHISQFRP
jgi:hypothetical protein